MKGKQAAPPRPTLAAHAKTSSEGPQHTFCLFRFLSLPPHPRPFKMDREDSGCKISPPGSSQKWLGAGMLVSL